MTKPWENMLHSLGMEISEDEYGNIKLDDRDYRGRGFEPSEETPDPLLSISSPGETATALRRIHGRSEAGWGQAARGRYRDPANQYAQYATMMLTNPTLPAAERANLIGALQQAGAPAYGSMDATGRAVSMSATFGPGALPGNTGLIGSRGGMSGLGKLGAAITGSLTKAAQTVSVWRKDRSEYDYYLVPRKVRLRVPPPPKGKPKFGEALDMLLPSLPRASLKVGHGLRARGKIVVDRNGGGSSLGALVAIALDRLER